MCELFLVDAGDVLQCCEGEYAAVIFQECPDVEPVDDFIGSIKDVRIFFPVLLRALDIKEDAVFHFFLELVEVGRSSDNPSGEEVTGAAVTCGG